MIQIEQTPGAGRGVFACRTIESGETIEQVPVIVIPRGEADQVALTILNSYCFLWDDGGETLAIALGLGSLYNHSFEPNAVYRKRFADRMIDFVAIRTIPEGAEVLINYNGRPDDSSPIVFDVATWTKLVSP